MTFHVTAADHTGITVADLDRSLEFWCGVLGFELARRGHLTGEFAAQVTGVPGADIDMAVVVVPGHRIELLQYNAPADRVRVRSRPCDVGAQHLALQVDDIDALLAAAAESGWEPAGLPQTMAGGPRAGTRFAYMRDADGTTVELIQPA
ncbi:VOC family protein [Saccharopolyspora sp. 7B]|uniref:VOC family protein n=1 Tax=Saccharopolyspora sp. 7B TaxID=2877240 RepID=UPI001CD34ED5|nr:VOC family protein [Saccharopolyspora sp. 7B]MCA1281538.1 VOC family protein [Saccharopolyspora sp. 7B]